MKGTFSIDVSSLSEVRKRMLSAFSEKQTRKLVEYAPLILKDAYNRRSFSNKTWNLADSYVWVVYYKGEVRGSGYLWNGRTASTDSYLHEYSERVPVNGRRLAEEFISSYVSTFQGGWEMVWAAVAPYARILQKGWESNGRMHQFDVVSSIVDETRKDLGTRIQVSANF